MESQENERLEDVFQEVIKEFATTQEFVKFAKSKHGLCLNHYEIQSILEDHRYSVEDQKDHLLQLWRQNQGAAACPQLIRETLQNYRSRKVSSDTTKESQPGSSPEREDPGFSPIRHNSSAEGMDEKGNLTNFLGTINGPVFVGNKEINYEMIGATAPAIDPSVPPLKPSATEINPDGSGVTVGGCSVEFPCRAVGEDTSLAFSYNVDPGPAPEGFIHASSMLSCVPPYDGRKHAKVKVDTWCLTKKSISAEIFRKDNGGTWDQIDSAPLTDEGHLELQYRAIDNLAVFVLADRLEDIEFKISCLLFNDANGKFAMGFCLRDDAIENIFKHKMKKEHPYETIKDLDPLIARVGDEIHFKITPGQEMQNTKLIVDQEFLSDFQGHISFCKPDKDFNAAFYEIELKRNGHNMAERKRRIPGKNSLPNDSSRIGQAFSKGDTNVEFLGKLRADNFLGSVENADIDMREFAGHSDEDEEDKPFWHENNTLTYEEVQRKKERALKKKDETLARLRAQGKLPNKDAPRRSGSTNIKFHGDVEARTVITDAKNVRIDQRRYKGKRRQKPPAEPKVEKLVKAEQERGGAGEDFPEEEEISESRQGPRAEAGEEPDPSNKAQPIWDDCEKKGSGSEDSKKETEGIPSGMKQQFHEESVEDDMAEPTWDKDDPNNPKNKNSRLETQGATGNVPQESEIRKRKEKYSETAPEPNKSAPVKKKKKPIDSLHVFLGLIIIVCLGFIAYSYRK